MAFEIAVRRDVVVAREEFAIPGAEFFDHGVVRPDVELALLAFGIRIERSGERALTCRHFAREPVYGLPRALPIERRVEARVGDGKQLEKLRVVVEHFLEMRDEPALVDRIARETAAEMVVDAALADVMKRNIDGAEIAGLAGAQAGAPQKFEQCRLRKFRRAARAAIDRIDDAAELLCGVVEFGGADRHPARLARRAFEPLHQRRAVLLDLLRLFAEQPRDLAQHIDKSGPAVTRRWRKIRAAPDRLAAGRQKHGQRPAALLAEMMQRRHVDLVDVRPLFAIDLDVDEQLIHDARGGVILEALVRHHMAPMASRIADRQKDWLSRALGFRKRFRAPRPPFHRIVLVLQEVRARFAREPVFMPGFIV